MDIWDSSINKQTLIPEKKNEEKENKYTKTLLGSLLLSLLYLWGTEKRVRLGLIEASQED